MMLRQRDVTLPELERALSQHGRGLRFAPPLEAAYEAQRGPSRDRHIRRYLLLSLAVNLFCLLCDMQAGAHVFKLALLFRVGLFMPVTLVARLALNRRRSARLRGIAAIVPLVVDTVLIVLLARLVSQPLTDRYLLGATIGIFAQTLIAPIPFGDTVRGLLVSLLAFCTLSLVPWASHWHPPVSPDLPIFLCGLGLSSLYERYRRERSDRKDFLLSEANQLRINDMQRMNQHLERLSSLDSLTGVFNRRYLDAALSRLWNLATEHERWIGVLMVDIDHFKSVNDTAGHRFGDYCLEQVAQVMQQSVRPGVDTVARYGGEEFVAILPEAGEAEAAAIAERVRTSIEALGLPGAAGRVITVSIGVAAIHPGMSPVALESFIESADQALYEAKHSGRNRLICRTADLQELVPA